MDATKISPAKSDEDAATMMTPVDTMEDNSVVCPTCEMQFSGSRNLSIHEAKKHQNYLVQLDGTVDVVKPSDFMCRYCEMVSSRFKIAKHAYHTHRHRMDSITAEILSNAIHKNKILKRELPRLEEKVWKQII